MKHRLSAHMSTNQKCLADYIFKFRDNIFVMLYRTADNRFISLDKFRIQSLVIKFYLELGNTKCIGGQVNAKR